MEHGGIRPGAGRPQGSVSEKTLSAWALREYIFQQIVENKEDIVKALIKQARNGNIAAIKQLFDVAVSNSGKLGDEMEEAN